MLIKSEQDEIQSFLADASNTAGGRAERVLFPESSEEVTRALAEAAGTSTPVTVAGAGTGIVGGRVPQGGVVLSTAKLNRVGEFVREEWGRGRATAGAGVVLSDFQREARARGLLYPPDPTEGSCYLGGTVATNASGARTFKYGPTRPYVRALKVALTTGDLLELRRGELFAGADGGVKIPLGGGRSIEARLPTYTMPATRKHAAGYFTRPGMDVIDLFVGSEGTLGVVTEVELTLLPQPEGVLAGVVFFREEDSLLAFVREARERSLKSRASASSNGGSPVHVAAGLDARALEYFDGEALELSARALPAGAARRGGRGLLRAGDDGRDRRDVDGRVAGTLREARRARRRVLVRHQRV